MKRYPGLILVLILLLGAVTLVKISREVNNNVDFFLPHLITADEKRPVQDLPPLLEGVSKIACIGDSITYARGEGTGYTDRLEEYLSVIFPGQHIQVLNRGISGEHSYQMEARYQRDAIATGAELIIIFAGVNDVGHGFDRNHPAGDGPAGTSLKDYLASMASMIEMAKENRRKVIVITPPTVFEDVENPMDKKLDLYCRELRALAQEKQVPVADVRHAFVEISSAYRKSCNATDYLLTTDGIHPNSLGDKVIAESVMNTIGITAQSRKNVLRAP